MKKWERLNELEAEQEKLKEKVREQNRLPIGGKATKMGIQYPMDVGQRKKDAEKAYDKLQNMREQEIENNAVKIKELRKEVYGSDAAKFHIMSAEDRKQEIEDKFNQQKFAKGGSVKSKSKPAVAIMIGMAPAKKMAKGGAAISEYGGKEKYASKAAMMKHEKKEPTKIEKKEEKGVFMAKGGAVKKKPMKGIINKFV